MPIPKVEPEVVKKSHKEATPTQRVHGIEIGSKMHAYCEARLLGMTPTQAARHAGYKSLGSLEHNSKVKAYLASQREVMRKRSQISRDDVLEGFKRAIDDARVLADPTAQIAGWREIGRMLGYYEPETRKLVLSIDQQQARRELEVMAEDELLRLAAGEARGEIVDADFDFLPAPGQNTEH